jgi:DNA-directed RNA polymerase specialized sigma24 family protein
MDVDLHACVSGDKHAWDAFVDRCSPIIYAAVQRTIGRHRGQVERADLEDVVQDARAGRQGPRAGR